MEVPEPDRASVDISVDKLYQRFNTLHMTHSANKCLICGYLFTLASYNTNIYAYIIRDYKYTGTMKNAQAWRSLNQTERQT